jgi:sulfur carrier protein
VKLSINGQNRDFPSLDREPLLILLVDLLEMKADRIAIERNGDIAPRSTWNNTRLQPDDKLEIVQFVGGGF